MVPHTIALEQLLDLRRRYLRSASQMLQARLPDAELMVLAFLAAELGLGEIAVDDPDLLAAVRAAAVEEYVVARSGRPLALRFLDGGAALPPPAAGVRRAAWFDGRRSTTAPEHSAESLAIVFLYGMAGGAPAAALQRVAALVAGPVRLLYMGGIAAALWRCTAAAVIPEDRRQWLADAVESLRALLGDASLDPLPLAAECLALRAEAQTHGEDDVPVLRGRVTELEDEVWALKTRLQAQQSAIARLGGSPASAAGDPARPEGRWTRS